MLRPLLILPGYKSSIGASGQIQRVFWESIGRQTFLPSILCDKGDMDITSDNNFIIAEEKKWMASLPRLIRKMGFPDLCHLPDLQVYSWLPFAYSVGRKACKENKFDYISSVSYPHSAHLIAYLLKKKTGLPWVAQFYDPWVEHTTLDYKTGFFKKINHKMERLVAEHADVIIHSNKKICDNWLVRYGDLVKNKMRTLPFSYNITELPELSTHEKGEKLKIAHIGHIYGGRSSVDFVKAVAGLMQTIPDIKERLSITYIGVVPVEEKQRIASYGINHLFTFVDTLPPEAIQKYYDETDIFLLLDVNLKESPFFPSKLMMYEYYRKPILGITTHGSVIENELKEADYPVFYYGDSSSIQNYLVKGIAQYDELFTFNQERWKIYQVDAVHNSYLDIVKNV